MTLWQLIFGLILCAICLPLGLMWGLACYLENNR